ncbi:hypothetical protein ACVMFA_007395 [Bradyrhizobium liaoningense]
MQTPLSYQWPMFALHTAGTTRLTVCVGQYALKFGRWRSGGDANQREWIEWVRATPDRRLMLCPILWAAPFGVLNIMRRAVPLTRQQQLALLDSDGFPDWDYMPGGPGEPFEYKESDWGYLDGRLVALDYAGASDD